MQKLNGYYYEFFRPGVTCDVIFFDDNAKRVLVTKRNKSPYKGYWVVPGGFLEEGETCEDCAKREVFEEIGVSIDKEKLLTLSHFDFIDDPRGQSLNLFFVYEVNSDEFDFKKNEEVEDVKFVNSKELDKLLVLPHHALMIRRLIS